MDRIHDSQQASHEARLLVVDDEPNIRDLLASSLRFAGFEVLTAADGNGALRGAEDADPDLIVLDVMLPDMDGFTVARRLRERDVTIPILFLTARAQESDKTIGLVAGGDDYLAKPFSYAELIARVKALIPILVPLFISAFRRADELATAMECRCYQGGEGRTKMKQLRYVGRDYVLYLLDILLVAGIILLVSIGL